MRSRIVGVLLIVAACDANASLRVDLKTDLIVGAEVDSWQISLEGRTLDGRLNDGDWLAGETLTVVDGLKGRVSLEVALLRDGVVVITRTPRSGIRRYRSNPHHLARLQRCCMHSGSGVFRRSLRRCNLHRRTS